MALFDWIILRLVALASSCLYKPWPDIFFTDKKYKKINPSDNIYCFLLIRNIFHFSSIKAFFPQNCEMKQDIKKNRTITKILQEIYWDLKKPTKHWNNGRYREVYKSLHIHIKLPIMEIQRSPYITLSLYQPLILKGSSLEKEHNKI